MCNLDEYKLATPTGEVKGSTEIEKCDKCGGNVYWYERGECRGNKLIHIAGTKSKYFKVAVFTCKKCQTPKTMTKLETITKIKELQRYLGFAEVEQATAIIEVNNDNILRLVADEYGCHVYEPFEILDNNESREITIVMDKVSIIVRSKEKFRKHETLIPF